MVINRFEVHLVALDPTIGSEIKKTRPCLVVSPDDINQAIRTVIVAPMTTRGRPYPTRVPCRFKGRDGQVVLDQIRTVDQSRLVTKLGRIDGHSNSRAGRAGGDVQAVRLSLRDGDRRAASTWHAPWCGAARIRRPTATGAVARSDTPRPASVSSRHGLGRDHSRFADDGLRDTAPRPVARPGHNGGSSAAPRRRPCHE